MSYAPPPFSPARRRFLYRLAALTVAFSAVSRPTAFASSSPLVVASHPIVADWVRTVGGSRLTVTALAEPHQDLHSVVLRPAHFAALREARLLVAMGLGVDAPFVRDAQRIAPQTPLLALGDTLPPDRLLRGAKELRDGHKHGHDHDDDHDHDHGGVDPHFWLDPTLVAEVIAPLSDQLSALLPDDADGVRARAEAFRRELVALHAQGREMVATIPEKQRKGFVPHQAFDYFNRAFGVELIGIDTVVPHGEITPQRIEALRARAQRDAIRVLFTEAHRTSRIAQTFAAQLGLTVAGPLYTETFAPDSRGPTTYVAMMRHNLGEICRALLAG
ncbi:zinc ABC transporter substrate-binding protein [Hydrogenophilus islandicus]